MICRIVSARLPFSMSLLNQFSIVISACLLAASVTWGQQQVVPPTPILCWGSNALGQAPATRAAKIGTFVNISAGGSHTCAVRLAGGAADGVECWGGDLAGQSPALTPGTFQEVSAGGAYTCGIEDNAAGPAPTILTCWGNDSQGQAPSTQVPTSGGGSSFTAVSAGTAHTCAINQGQFIECWGDDSSGQAPAVRH